MPAVFSDPNLLALIRSLAERGDVASKGLMALMDNTYYAAQTSVGAEAGDGAAANSIRVRCQIRDQDGSAVAGVKSVLITSKPIAGAGTITGVALNGTVKAGSASVACWMETTSAGVFAFDVLDASAEDCLVMIQLDNGTTEMLKLTFA